MQIDIPDTPTVADFTQLRQDARAGDRQAKLTLKALAAQRKAEVEERQAASTRKGGTVADHTRLARERREADEAKRRA